MEGWAREGATDEQIAAKIGISRKTFYEWQNRFGDIRNAIKKGKAPVDFAVENALLKSALGYYVTVKEPIKLRTELQTVGKGKKVEERIEFVEKQVYIPPNNAAQIFWLKNRKPAQWRDKPEPPMSMEALERLDEVLSNIKGVI